MKVVKIHLPDNMEDQVGKLSSQAGIDALFIAAIVMALAALAIGWSAVGLHSASQLAYRILVATGFMGMSVVALWVGMALRGTDPRFRRAIPIPIPIPVGVRERVRRRR